MSDNSLETTTQDAPTGAPSDQERPLDEQPQASGDTADESSEVTQGAEDPLETSEEQTTDSSEQQAESPEQEVEEPATPASAEVSSYEPEAEPGGASVDDAAEPVAEEPATFAAPQAESVEAEADAADADSEPEETVEQPVEAPAAEIAPAQVAASANGEVAAEETEEDEDEEEVDDFFAPGDWFVVHTYAGYENKVKANLASRIQSMNMEDKIYDVVVPTEEVMELKSGKMQSVQKKVFPGYILVRMQLDDDSWYVVRNTPGVTGFVGSGAKPTPLDHSEVTKILAPKIEDRPKPKLEYEIGEVVSVIGGAFAGYSGPVETIDQEKQQVRVLLDLFGRETPVELMFDQVTKL